MTGTIHFVSDLPDEPGTCAHFAAGARPPAGWRGADIRERCHRHQREWGRALTSWHSEMMAEMAKATPWAWLLPGSRIHVWQPQIRPLLFALGVCDYFRENPGAELWAVDCPREVAVYVQEFLGDHVVIDWQSGAAPGPHPALHRARDTASVLRRVTWRPRRRATANADLLVFSIVLGAKSVRETGDHYFGRVLDSVDLRVQWLHQLTGSSGRTATEDEIARTGQLSSWVHDWIGWPEAMALLAVMARVSIKLRAARARLPALVVGPVRSRMFARRFFDELLLHGPMLGELMVFRATRRLLQAARPKAVTFPYEEKAMEHAVILAAREVGCTTIGFAHAAYTSGHLYLQEPRESRADRPRPDRIAAAGQGAGQWLRLTFDRTEPVTEVGSPRWMSPPAGAVAHRPARPLRVLVITSFAFELQRMADWMDEDADLFGGAVVTVRPNPKEWPTEQALAIERLHRSGHVIVDGTPSLQDQIDACDVAIFCATSAAAEAIWRGRVAVYTEWNDLWATDPTKDKVGELSVPKCLTAADLRSTLAAIAAMDEAAYAKTVSEQRAVAKQIYEPFRSDRFRELVLL